MLWSVLRGQLPVYLAELRSLRLHTDRSPQRHTPTRLTHRPTRRRRRFRTCNNILPADAQPAPDMATFVEVTRPSTIDGQYAPGLRFGDPRVMAVLAALVGFTHLLAGFDNRSLVRLVTA
jgi:hypothetical protein